MSATGTFLSAARLLSQENESKRRSGWGDDLEKTITLIYYLAIDHGCLVTVQYSIITQSQHSVFC